MFRIKRVDLGIHMTLLGEYPTKTAAKKSIVTRTQASINRGEGTPEYRIVKA